MSGDWSVYKCCPFFQVHLRIRKVNNLIQVWQVTLKIERSRRGLYLYRGYSIGNQVVVEKEDSPNEELQSKILHGTTYGLKDPWWWHTILCRVCPVTKDYRLCEVSEDSDSDSEDGRVCISDTQWALANCFL